ncbi:unnamed protein product [Orchesella dallaii]|uniref:Glypican-6 n=1 Tax=Orchesella dallaii TaxID=48710 RepID=A0ABP1PNE6_9HEXA
MHKSNHHLTQSSSKNGSHHQFPHLHYNPKKKSSYMLWLSSWRKQSSMSLCVFISILYLLSSPSSITLVNAAKGPGSRNNANSGECGGIGHVIKNKGFTYPWWDQSPLHAAGLVASNEQRNSSLDLESISGCPLGQTGQKGVKCCRSFDTVTQKNEIASMFNEKWMGPKLASSAEIFKERKKKFDVTFKDLLTRAHGSFHAMFERTYGMLYIQHAPIFHALFTTLETYYDTGRDSLEAKLNEFFAILTRKMFEVLNAQYDFDDAYLSCATIVVSEKQGGDLHRQIVSSLRRSFVATRALAQGLAEADRVLTNLQKIKVPQDCLLSLSQMVHCPVCAEQRAFKPCLPLCTSVTTKCLLSTASMNKPWTEFTSALEGILDRLLGPYNVEAVVEPIHIKISEAIMNFQESGTDLSQAVFAKCGKPKLKSATRSFHRRDVPPLPLKDADDDDMDVHNDKGDNEMMQADRHGDVRGHSSHHDDTQPSKSLEKLLKEIKNKVKKSKTLWNVLPRQVCNGISKDYSSQLCWNGSAAIRPDRNKSAEESEVGLPPGKGPPNILVAEQVLILQLITDKLRASYNGLDVQWVQDIPEELDFEGSGSVLGSGSGEIPDDLEEGDDDDPSGRIKQDRRPPIIPPSSTTNFNQPGSRPRFPARPPPPILTSHSGSTYGGNDGDEDEDEDDDDDDDGDGNIRNWNIGPNFNPTSNNRPTIGGGDLDFAPPPQPPYVNEGPPIPFTIPTTTTTTTTTSTVRTTTTRKPSDLDVRKTTVNSSGHGGDTSSAIAVFKLFSPIIVSMIGKVFSFS